MSSGARRAALLLEGVTKRFPSPGTGGPVRTVLDGVDLEVRQGTCTAVLGPSGGGKTTLLRIVAGLETPDAGRIRLAGGEVNGPGVFVPPERRRVGFVFQDYALFPHLTARENAAFGVPGPTGRTRAREALRLVGLEDVGGHRPHELSGGEQQRVALARALAPQPALVLLDEPFSNLDAALRAGVREEVARILSRLDMTAVLVTHDREEAFLLADRVVLLLGGRVVRAGAPEDLARDPGSRAAARFLGETNLLPAESDGKRAVSEIGPVELLAPWTGGAPPTGRVEVLLPVDGLLVEPFAEERPGPSAAPPLAKLVRAAFHGAFQLLEARLPSGRILKVRSPARELWQGLLSPGQSVRIRPAGPAPAYPRGDPDAD